MTLRGHFDGRVIVLDDPPPADWSANKPVIVTAVPAPPQGDGPIAGGPSEALLRIAASASDLGLPPDFSEQLDHYIHGTPKR